MTVISLLVKYLNSTFGGPLSLRLLLKKSDLHSDFAFLLQNTVEMLQKYLQLDFTKRLLSIVENRNLFTYKQMITQVSFENPVLDEEN